MCLKQQSGETARSTEVEPEEVLKYFLIVYVRSQGELWLSS